MRKAILSIVVQKEIPLTALTSSTADKFLPDWDKFFFVLDMSENQIANEKTIQFLSAEFRSAEKCFSELYNELVFFFNKEEMTEFVKIVAAKKILEEYDMVIITNSDILYNESFKSI